jgi:hypothetical protein
LVRLEYKLVLKPIKLHQTPLGSTGISTIRLLFEREIKIDKLTEIQIDVPI